MKIKLLALITILLVSHMACAENENVRLTLRACTVFAPQNYKMLYAAPSNNWDLNTREGKQAAWAMSSGKNPVVDMLRNYFGEEYQVYNTPSTSVRLNYVNLIYGDEAMRREMTPERARTLMYIISRPPVNGKADKNGLEDAVRHANVWTTGNKQGLNYAHFLEAIKFYREDGIRIVGTPLQQLMDLLWQNNPKGALAYLDHLSQTPEYKAWWNETQELCILAGKSFDIPGWSQPRAPQDWSWLPGPK